jgi:glycosyltransferase involved in cell wall biosynthesis
VTDRRGVSFVVTVYNKEPYVADTIRSILNQEGDFEREIIVVDNASTDRSPEVIKAVLDGLPNAKIITNEKNNSVSRALNLGVAAATMAVIKTLDGDDLLAPFATKRLLKGLEFPGVALVYGLGTPPLESAADLPTAESPHDPVFLVMDDPLPYCLRTSLAGCSSVLFRRDAFIASGGCDETVFIQDQTYILRMAVHHKFAWTEEVFFFAIKQDGGTLQFNSPQVEHDRSAGVLGLVRDHPNLALGIKRLALRRASARAWNWARRVEGKTLACHWTFWLKMLAHFPWLFGYAGLLSLTTVPYRHERKLRLPEVDGPELSPVFKIAGD